MTHKDRQDMHLQNSLDLLRDAEKPSNAPFKSDLIRYAQEEAEKAYTIETRFNTWLVQPD